MFSPIDGERPPNAPLLAASMTPGPPPLITANPASDRRRARSTVCWYNGASRAVRALPKIDTAGPPSDRRSAAPTNPGIIPHSCHDSPAFFDVAPPGMGTARKLGTVFLLSV